MRDTYLDGILDVRVEHVGREQLEPVLESEDVLQREGGVVLVQSLHLGAAVREHLEQLQQVFFRDEHVILEAYLQVVFQVLLAELEVDRALVLRGRGGGHELLEALGLE